MTRTILITAASGHIGQELLPLLDRLEETRVILPTSNASRLKASLPNSNAATFIVEEGSVRDPTWFQGLLTQHEVDTVFLCLTGEDELFTTMNCFDCLSRAKSVKHLIYLSACADFASPEGAQWILRNCSAGHVLVKILTEQKLVYGDFPFTWTVIRPSLFFINDLRAKKSLIESGMYDEPLGENGVSRVSPSDIALAVKNVFVDGSGRWVGKHVPVGSQKAYKGSEIARIWSDALEKEVDIYPANQDGFERYEHELGARENAIWGRDMRLMVESFAKDAFCMTEEEYQLQVELLGKIPEDYEVWVKDTASKW
ncbi:hypothetical protein N7466_010952 [Penicillium verhagenii]|uniref:uncharacterized protein n=1 Tax=Penicillium verhagenii TaxID=1562060 RepID=UPI0025453F0E|nr:uncharacterized protein N7466_010952 [Penicillium verhagenii]KAJ5917398.1 hypothetical protein N7466_010952 [Penicillium verhagenii]